MSSSQARSVGPAAASDTPAWRRVLPNPSVVEYVTASGWIPGFNCAIVQKALKQCYNIRNQMQLDLSCLFWSTQAKEPQIRFRNLEVDLSDDFHNDRDHFLCFRCARWIPGNQLARHLPYEELVRFCASHISTGYLIPDRTDTCRMSSSYQYSRVESNYWHLRYLNLPDYPSFCQKCNCVVMVSALPLHDSHDFCRHAKLATSITFGIFSKTRFSYYPGHPLHHFFYVGKWPILALLALRNHEKATWALLFGILNRTRALSVLDVLSNVDVSTVRDILSFLVPPCSWCQNILFSDTVEDIVELTLDDKRQTAKRYLCLIAKCNSSSQLRDRFGLSMA